MVVTVIAWPLRAFCGKLDAPVPVSATEVINLGIETVRRTGHGFRDFDNYRLRLILSLGVK